MREIIAQRLAAVHVEVSDMSGKSSHAYAITSLLVTDISPHYLLTLGLQ